VAHKPVTRVTGVAPSLLPLPNGSSPSWSKTVALVAAACSSRREGRARSVLEMQPVVVEPVQYELQKKYCATCHRAVCATAPGVLPKSLFGNQLTAHVLTSHYLHGEPLGRISERLNLNRGSLMEMAHRVARPFGSVIKELSAEYRRSPVRHADETGWRTDGQSGYAWLFCTEKTSIFLFRRTRSASVPKEVLGTRPLSGVLVVDRYNAYNRAPCSLQYCFAHLLRDVEDLQKEFATDVEVGAFTATLIPLLAQAMHVRRQPITDADYYAQAREIKRQIILVTEAEARHPGIRRLQDLFHDKAERLYHWVESREVPAENNRAERELRPTVIARKVSNGVAIRSRSQNKRDMDDGARHIAQTSQASTATLERSLGCSSARPHSRRA